MGVWLALNIRELLSNLKACMNFHISIHFQNSGPMLPLALNGHAMVKLGKGQAILGGYHQANIYFMGCSNRNWIISLLNRELSVPKGYLVAIPIPDTISGCITQGNKYLPRKIYMTKYLFYPQI